MSAGPRRRRSLLAAALPVLLVGVGAGTPVAAPAAELPVPAPPGVTIDPVEGIDPVEAGLAGPVSEVIEEAPDRGAVRLVVTSAGADGELEVTSHVATDKAEAAEVVRDAREDETTVTVGVQREYHAVPVRDDTRAAVQAAVQATPSADPGRGEQWALTTLAAESAWARSTGSGVTVAVVDSGVDGSHPDLAAAVLPGADFVGTSGDGRTDANGHGTHVAGIVAATAGNGIGVAGLAPGAKVLPVRVMDRAGRGFTSAIAEGIVWAADNGADVINLSLGGPDKDAALSAAITHARSKGAVVVAAAGNSALPCAGSDDLQCGNPVLYPAADPGVVAVGASDPAGKRAPFSQWGPQLDVVAPGVAILSTVPACTWDGTQVQPTCTAEPGYESWAGTSMAAPFVAATAALVRSSHPTMSGAQVEALLTATAKDLGAAGRDDHFGHGLVQPVAAVMGQPTPTPAPAPARTTTKLSLNDRTVHAGTYVTATVSVTAGTRRVSGPASVCVREVADRTARCSTVTVKDGRGTRRFKASFGSYVTATFRGTTTDARSSATAVRVYVTPRVTGTGGYRRLTFQVSAAQRQRAAVQRYYRGAWRTVRTVTVVGTSRSTVTWLPRGVYRVSVPATRELQAARSGSLRVR